MYFSVEENQDFVFFFFLFLNFLCVEKLFIASCLLFLPFCLAFHVRHEFISYL